MLLTGSHKENIKGCLYCYDRVIINATAGTFGYAGGMSAFFYQKEYKIFDFAKIFTPVTESIKSNAESIATENGLTI